MRATLVVVVVVVVVDDDVGGDAGGVCVGYLSQPSWNHEENHAAGERVRSTFSWVPAPIPRHDTRPSL